MTLSGPMDAWEREPYVPQGHSVELYYGDEAQTPDKYGLRNMDAPLPLTFRLHLLQSYLSVLQVCRLQKPPASLHLRPPKRPTPALYARAHNCISLSALAMSHPPTSPPGADDKNVVYHVYQHSSAESLGQSIVINGIPVAYYARPILLFFQWAFWVIYLAGAAQASSALLSAVE